MTDSVATDYICTSEAVAGSTGSVSITFPSNTHVKIPFSPSFSGTVDITCTHDTDSTIAATYSLPLTIVSCSSVLSSPASSPESVIIPYDSSTAS
jgi:hypothetical protein